MPDFSIGRLRGGFAVYWTGKDGRRVWYQLSARTRAEAEPEAIDVYRTKMFAESHGGATVSLLWENYRKDLGAKPTAETMG